MDIVQEKRIREWTLLGLVASMAVVANLPAYLLVGIGVERGLLMAVLGVLVVLALFLYVRFFCFLLYTLLTIGANLPEQWAVGLGISREMLLTTLIAMVAMSLLNYGAKLLPTGLEPKQRKQDPRATEALVSAIEHGKLSYVKTLLTMDFDIDARDEQGMTPLMLAARRGDARMVEMILKRGAAPALTGASGKAADIALQHNFPALSERLRRAEEAAAVAGAAKASG